MNKNVLAALAACCWTCLTTIAAAQPALDRLERQLAPPDRAGAEREAGYLGVVADDREENGAGVRLVEVLADGPGHMGGLRSGDLLTAINGRPVQSMPDMVSMLEGLPPGEQLAFTVLRGKTRATIDVTLGRRPPPGKRRFEQFGRLPEGPGGAAVPRAGLLGVRVEPVTPDVQAQTGAPAARGAVVVSVVEQSAAALAGLPIGAVIVGMDGIQVDTPTDLATLVSAAGPGKEVTLAYYLDGVLQERKVTLAQPAEEFVGEDLETGLDLPPPGAPAATVRRRPAPGLDEGDAASSPPDESPPSDPVEARIEAIEARLDRFERLLEQIVAGQQPPAPAKPKPRKTTP